MKRADAAAAPFGRARPAFGLRRHRRLLALCGVSALVHVALLQLFAARMPQTPRSAAAEQLVVRLAPPAPAAVPDAAAAGDAAPAPGAVPALPGAPPATPPSAASAAARSATPAAAPSIAPSAPPSATARAPGAPADTGRMPAAVRWDVTQPQASETAAASGAEPSAAPPVQMPGRYRVRMPDAVRLTYVQTRQAPAAAKPVRVPDAHIDWRSDGARYAMRMDGVLGRLGSRGASGDAGIVPRSAVEERDGARLATEFTLDGRILFDARGAGAPGNIGHQDRASLLMQLAGIGLGEPGQMQDVIEVVVAGAADAAIVRFQVMETETLATPLGAIDAVRLAQRGAPGQARLEVWLAPGRGWLPVQLRVTGPDGAVATQTLRAIAAGSAPPAE